MIAVKGGYLIDCTGAEPLRDAVVLVEGNRIEKVGPAATVPLPEGVEVIDVGEATILPGLIDAHEHLGLCQELGYERGQMQSPETDICFRMARNARRNLKSGTTTVRTVGDKRSLDLVCRRAIEDGFYSRAASHCLGRRYSTFPRSRRHGHHHRQRGGRGSGRSPPTSV